MCPSWVVEEADMGTKEEVGPSYSPATTSSADLNKLQQPMSTRNPLDSTTKKAEDASKYLSACNVVHKRYFFPPVIERLCRCPDRTECPMEWSQPPLYKDLSRIKNKEGSRNTGRNASQKSVNANAFDPFTVMVSSRTQLKVKVH